MVASPAMRAIRDLPLAASLVLVAYALFFGGGAGDRSLLWLGAGAIAAVVASMCLIGAPAGLRVLVPFAALTAWLAVSIIWSTLPDRSWVYANRVVRLPAARAARALAGPADARARARPRGAARRARGVDAPRQGRPRRLRLRAAGRDAPARPGGAVEPARAARRLRAAARTLAEGPRRDAARLPLDRHARTHRLAWRRGGGSRSSS